MSFARVSLPLALLAVGAGFAACGAGGGGSSGISSSASAPVAAKGGGSWTRFGYSAARYGRAPRGLGAGAVAGLHEHSVSLPGTVDSSPIYLAGVDVKGSRRNLLVVETSYGRVLGLDASSGATLWTYTPPSYQRLAGSAQITQSTPVADSSHRFVYAVTPDGNVRKLRVADGSEVTGGAWPTSVTRDATHEKTGASLNVEGKFVLVTTGGYIGDAPPYQGKVVAVNRRNGRISHVVNSLCSNRRRIIKPSSCSASDSAIFGRGGAVVDPANGRVYVATGNAPWNGRTNWGDSVLELSPGAKRLRRHFTPTNQAQLDSGDADLGSASPGLLPAGKGSAPKFLIQGGKDGKLRLLSLKRSLHGVKGRAGRHLGGQVQTLPLPGGDSTMFTAPAVLHKGGTTLVFVGDGAATAGYRLSSGRLHKVWEHGTAGTSPVIAGRLLWVYDPNGSLNVYRPQTGKLVRSLGAPSGHWNSPIVAGGRVYLPTGDANSHDTNGELSSYAP